jgi:CHAT domain-containing protein
MLLGRVRFDDWNIATLVVLPDGPLWRVPFHALPVPSHWPGAEQRRLLGEIAPVVVVPSLTAYQRFQNRAQKRAPFHALIVSDPDTGGSAPPLDAAALEAQGIAAIYGDAAPIVSGRAATPDALWAGMQDRDVLHLIAHGLTDEANGDAWILFSDGRGGATRLALGDLANRRMALQTVFLSACSTGAGRESVGEGLMSVARAFLMAGARSVVASLWPISDRDAPAFVAEFHEQLQGGSSVAAALGTAAARARERKAHPRLWAAFQAYGDGHGRLARNRIADLLKGDSGGDRV